MTIGAAIVVATVLVLARYLPDFRQGLFITFFALAVATLGTGNREMTIGVAIVLATVLVLATHHPGFRRGLLVILSALAIAGASVAFLAMLERDHRQSEEYPAGSAGEGCGPCHLNSAFRCVYGWHAGLTECGLAGRCDQQFARAFAGDRTGNIGQRLQW